MSSSDDDLQVNRVVSIRARRSIVFRYFTDTERFAAWWGPGSSIDPKPGGSVEIRYPNGATAGGEVVEIAESEKSSRIVFTYGYDDPKKPIARGASRVTITLEDERGGGTLVRLVHHVDSKATRDQHVPGWRFQLSTFANVVAKELADPTAIAALLDRFFGVWSEADAEARLRTLAEVATDAITFRDAFASIEGRADLADHIGASQIHMPGVALKRDGDPIACQGTVLVDWIAVSAPDGKPIGARGTNVLELLQDERGPRIAGVTGFWRK